MTSCILPCSVLAAILVSRCASAQATRPAENYCNPLDLNYRFALRDVSKDNPFREAADPSMAVYQGEYWLFCSKSGGYWHSKDLRQWTFVQTKTLPTEPYAPDVHVIGGKLAFVAWDTDLYTSDNPAADQWTKAGKWKSAGDPNLFPDDDGKTYFYQGCSNKDPITGQQIDPSTWTLLGDRVPLFAGDMLNHGWERSVIRGNRLRPAFIEGAWMNKIAGKYYLQYAGPGTEFSTYADGYYTAASPLGPFTYAANSPFSLKPGGFITGAGHGSTFADKFGNLWHVATMRISIKHSFERRIGLFPAGIDSAGRLFCNTSFGDYPTQVPSGKWDPWKDPSTGWMLLSHPAAATASSSLESHTPDLAADEDIRTYWSARTGNPGEWIQLDLGSPKTVHALQLNVAENAAAYWGREGEPLAQKYLLESSLDGQHWSPLLDTRNTLQDSPHHYLELATPQEIRYLRLTNSQVAGGGTFAVSGLRVFGKGHGQPPAAPAAVTARRGPYDPLTAAVTWTPSPGATGYNIRFGEAKDRLYNSWLVYDAHDLQIPSLNSGVGCWVQVDAFNENGVTPGKPVEAAPVLLPNDR